MNNPYYPNPHLFTPSMASLNSWLKTRKLKAANTKFPGLFKTDGFSADQAWVVIALVIEVLALLITLYGAYTMHQFGKMLYAVLIVILFVVLDFVGVLSHSKSAGEKCLLRNQIALSHDAVRSSFYSKQLSEIPISQFFGVLLFIISAGLKILSLVVFAKIRGVEVPLLSIFYLIVIYIHTFHTGYWYNALVTSKKIKNEYNKWESEATTNQVSGIAYETKPWEQVFESKEKLSEDVKLNFGRQTIELIPGKSGVYTYRISSNGLMWDADVINIVMGFTGHTKDLLVEHCIKLQLTQLNIV